MEFSVCVFCLFFPGGNWNFGIFDLSCQNNGFDFEKPDNYLWV